MKVINKRTNHHEANRSSDDSLMMTRFVQLIYKSSIIMGPLVYKGHDDDDVMIIIVCVRKTFKKLPPKAYDDFTV